ncbi:MAG: thermonuclease family protein, partial [Gemmatimonadota bacterium]|nr:thermonuclease family protein [Gemmatimonadota bacterium]
MRIRRRRRAIADIRRETRPGLRSTALPVALLVACLTVQELSGPVTRVFDGDTIDVELAGGRERVRYIGIDTPEMDDERPAVRARAREAAAANRRLVAGRTVRLELDVEERDRYGRLLAYVWIGDTLVNEVLVREGHARLLTIPPNVRHADRLRRAARLARGEPAGPGDAGLEAAGPEADAAPPPAPADTVPAAAAAALAGKVAVVCGRVAGTRYLGPGRLTFLNLGRPYPDQEFTVVIHHADREAFPEPPERAWRGREICVTGRVSLYRGT